MELRAVVRSRWIYALGFGLSAFFVYAFYFMGLNRSMPSWWSDTYEYAQVAHNLAQGRGLVTFAPHVVEAYLLRAQPLPLPYMLHDPGQPLLMSLFFRVLGASDTTIGWMSGTFYILLVPLTYLFARRAFNPTVANVAAFLALVNNQLIGFGLTGLSEVPFAFFLTCCLYSLYRHRAWWDVLLTGVLFGWLMVLRSNALPILVFSALFLLLDPPEVVGWQLRTRLGQLWRAPLKPLLNVALLVLGVAAAFVPSAARTYSLIQHPLYNIASIYSLVFYTSAIEGKSITFLSEPGLAIDPAAYILSHPEELVSKIQYQLGNTLPQLFEGGIDNRMTWIDAVLIVLLLVSVIVPRPNEPARRKYLRWLVYVCLATALAAGAVTHLRWRHVYGFIPMVLIIDADLMLFIMQRLRASLHMRLPQRVPVFGAIFVVVLLTLGALGLVAAQRATIIGDAENRQYRAVARWVEPYLAPDALVLAEQGEGSFGMQSSLAWYTGREFIEYSEYTTRTIPAKRGVQPMYLLLIDTDAKSQGAILAAPEFAGYTEIARLNRARFPQAVLYSLSKVSLKPE